ncbi:MAG: endonuclease domain-containing protein [Humibacillus sp.]|nr:endonuclease domain-containing protein [Humibacillus sp.]
MDLYALAPSGVFSAAAAKAYGIGAPLLRLLVSEGKAFPLHRGWYAVQRPVNDKHRHRLRVAALLQEYEGQVMASHGSAIAWLDLPDEDIEWGTVHLMWKHPEAPFRAFSRVHIHELVRHHGLSHGRDVVDVALAAVQVGLRSQSSMLVLADHALQHGMTTPERLRAAVAALNGNRGILQARAALAWCDGRHATPGETLTALVLRGLSYEFTPQFEIVRREQPGRSFFADFRIKDTRVLVEFDGRVKYDPSQNEGAATANFDEKRREDEIRRSGYWVVRVTRADLRRAPEVYSRIEETIRTARMLTA